MNREVVGVTEARHWHGGRRESDSVSLLHFWVHFADIPEPLMAHSCGEQLSLTFGHPYAAYEMQEHEEVRVEPARAPDLLASLPSSCPT